MATAAERALGSIRLSFDEKKATAAAGVLLKHAGGRMRYLRLIKLLYLADRESLDRTGQPIVGGRYVAMKYGPVLSEVLDLVKGRSGTVWAALIELDGFEVKLKHEPELGPLSRTEIALLIEAATLHQQLDQWKLAELTHAFPEWTDPGAGAKDISPEDILRALKKSDEEIEDTRQAAIERTYFDELFGR